MIIFCLIIDRVIIHILTANFIEENGFYAFSWNVFGMSTRINILFQTIILKHSINIIYKICSILIHKIL